MSRQHFEALAYALKRSRPTVADFTKVSADGRNTFTNMISHDAAYAAWLKDVRAITDVCAESNGRFDRDRFLAACGVE